MNPAELLYDCETDILESIAERLAHGDVGSADWKIERMAKLAAVSEQSIAIIRRYRDDIRRGAVSAVDEAAYRAALTTERAALAAKKAGAKVANVLPVDIDPAIENILTTWETAAVSGVNLSMASLAQQAGSSYVEAINRANMAVLAGGQSGQASLVQCLREWSATGLPNFIDASNRHWTTEAYASMIIRTNTRKVTTEVSFARGDEFGTDLIEVSSHSGARPGCAPYQGKIYSRNGKSEKYPDLATTSYGEAAGLFGINCGHNAYPYFEGLSTKRYDPTEDAEENAEQYEQSQKQRKYERSIRAAKRELRVMQAVQDDDGIAYATKLISDRQAALRDFIEETGRTRRSGREQVYDTAQIVIPRQSPTIYHVPNDSGNIPLDIGKVQKIRIPQDIKTRIIASGGINSPILKQWIRENWV